MLKNSFIHLKNSDNPGLKITREAIVSFIFQITFAVLSFLIMAFLARFLGAEDYGAYTNAIAWANIFAYFAPFGLSILLVREVAVMKSNQDYENLKGLLGFSDYFVLLISVFLSILLIIVANLLLLKNHDQTLFKAMVLSAPLIPLWAFALMQQSILRGIEKPIYALAPDIIIRPAITLVLIILFFFFLPSRLNSNTVIVLSVTSSIIALVVALAWSQNFLRRDVSDCKPKYEIRKWMISTFPLFFYNATQVVIAQAPLVLLGLLGTTAGVGFFNVALRLSSILLYLPLAVGMVLGPVTARLYSQNDKEKLQNILKLSTFVTFIADVLIFLFFILFGEKILAIFGSEFIPYSSSLIILTSANLIDGALGNSPLLLTMTGSEKTVAIINGAAALVYILLSPVILPGYGVWGAALLFTIIMSLMRIAMMIFIAFKLRMNITIFPLSSLSFSKLKSVFSNG